jgi:hypothetical protein
MEAKDIKGLSEPSLPTNPRRQLMGSVLGSRSPLARLRGVAAGRERNEPTAFLRAMRGIDIEGIKSPGAKGRGILKARAALCWISQTVRADRFLRHQASRPPPAKISPGRPAPAMGPGTAIEVVSLTKRTTPFSAPQLGAGQCSRDAKGSGRPMTEFAPPATNSEFVNSKRSAWGGPKSGAGLAKSRLKRQNLYYWENNRSRVAYRSEW